MGMAALIGLGITSAALIDASREGVKTLEGYLFVGIATTIPWVIGLIGMLFCFVRRLSTYSLWTVGTFVVLLPGLLLWTFYAARPSLRAYSGAGQMHIFLLPIVHIGYGLLIYSGTVLLGCVVSRDPKV